MIIKGTYPKKREYSHLVEKYKHLFTREGRNPVAMFGFECGIGWYVILENLINQIDSYLNHKYKGEKTDFEIVQIKEKFGGLRFYVHNGDDVIYELISITESLSYKTCEHCGSTSEIARSKGWVITACKKCIYNDDAFKTKEWTWVDAD